MSSVLKFVGEALLAAAGDVAVAGVKAIAKAIKRKVSAPEAPSVPLLARRGRLGREMRLRSALQQRLGDKPIDYELFAVSGEANKPWSTYTPTGDLKFRVTNPECPELTEGEYLVTLERIEPAPETKPSA